MPAQMLLKFLFVFSIMGVCWSQNCPPVSTQSPFNMTEYVRAPWYVQMQMPIKYLPLDSFYCVRATYTQTGNYSISVNNYACNGGINIDPYQVFICAIIPDHNDPSKLAVGPCNIPHFLFGPYWVVAAGPSLDNYQWALVSGGQPTIETPYGCKTGVGENGSGLWVLSRTPVAPEDQVDQVLTIAKQAGFDITVLLPVTQEGCTYPPAPQ